jgi:hypothetical protein
MEAGWEVAIGQGAVVEEEEEEVVVAVATPAKARSPPLETRLSW